MDYYEIGQRIRKFRRAQGLSQEQLAEQVGISITHMSHIETGNTKLSLPVLVALANALHTGTDELIFEAPKNLKQKGRERILDVLDACTPQEINIIAEIIESAKVAMDKYK